MKQTAIRQPARSAGQVNGSRARRASSPWKAAAAKDIPLPHPSWSRRPAPGAASLSPAGFWERLGI